MTRDIKINQIKKFWDVTSRWYFFPILYLILVIIVSLYWVLSGLDYIENIFSDTIFIFIFLPAIGLLYSLSIFKVDLDPLQAGVSISIIFFIFLMASIIHIRNQKINYNGILKWLIIILFLIIILVFVGAAAWSYFIPHIGAL